MASRKASEQIRDWLDARGIARVTEGVFAELGGAFPKLRGLRRAVRACGLPLDPLVEGIRQDSWHELARTLTALQHEHEATGDQRIRAMVIESKTHARLASLNRPGKREMVEWMLVWLHDPSLFETWVKLRLRSLSERGAGQVPEPDAHEADEH